jgi:hypothetical protein
MKKITTISTILNQEKTTKSYLNKVSDIINENNIYEFKNLFFKVFSKKKKNLKNYQT